MTAIPGLLKEFLNESDQLALMTKAVIQKFQAGQFVTREEVPANLYFVMSGEISLRSGNVADLSRVSNGRALDLRCLLANARTWDSVWRVERDAEILSLPWTPVAERLMNRPRQWEYLIRITQHVEIQKLKRDLRVFGYEKRGIIDLVSSLNFANFAEVLNSESSEGVFCVISEGFVETKVTLHDREESLLYLGAGDQGLIDPDTTGQITVRCSSNAKGWYLAIPDIRRLASTEQFVRFLRLYTGRKNFGVEDEDEVEKTVWTPAPKNFMDDAQTRLGGSATAHNMSPYHIQYFTPKIREIESSWAPAAALVRMGQVSGVPIGLYAARQSLLGEQSNSLIRGLFNVANFLKFRVKIETIKSKLDTPIHLPFLCTVGASPVIVWTIKGSEVTYEVVGEAGLKTADRNHFEATTDGAALVWQRSDGTRSIEDERISLLSYLEILKEAPFKVSTLVLSGALSFLISLSAPMIYQYFFTSVLNSKRWSIAGVLIASYFGSRLLNTVLEGIENSVTFALMQNNQTRFVSALLMRLSRVPLKFYDFLGQTELLSRFEESFEVGTILSEVIVRPAAKLLSISTCLVILYWYHPKIAMTALLIIPIVASITLFAARRRKRLNIVAEHFKAAERRLLIEAFDHPETNRVNNVSLMTRWRWEENYIASTSASLKFGIENAFLTAFDFLCQESSKFLILSVGLSLFAKGELTQGQVLACFLLTERLTSPLWSVLRLFYDIPSLMSHLERFDPIFNTDEERPSAPGTSGKRGSTSPDIEFRNVSFQYGASAREVLSDISFRVAPGEKVGIVGPSGSGKSALIALLNGSRAPTKGSVTIDGRSINSIDLTELRRRVGVVSQNFNLFHGTIFENITMGAQGASLSDAAKAAFEACADGFISKLPNSYGFMVHRGGGGLSEGQTQRIAVARMLFLNPDVLVLDEATSHLDSVTEETLLRELLEQRSDRSIIFVTQRANLLSRMDRILVLQDGKISGQGKHLELIGKSELYTDLFTRQVALN